MKPVFRVNLFALILVLLQVLGANFAGILLNNLSIAQRLIVSQLIFLIIPSIIYFIITKQSIKETLRLNKISVKEILLCFLLAFLAQPVAWFFSFLSNLFFQNSVAQVFDAMKDISYPAMLGVMALTPAICEEITMRGIVLSGYDNKTTFKASLMTGLIFGILHMNGQQFLYAFALGILFGYLVRITNSIFSTMICHFTFNGIQVSMSRLFIKNLDNIKDQSNAIMSMSVSEKINYLIVLFSMALVFSAIIFLVVRSIKKNREKNAFEYSNVGNSCYVDSDRTIFKSSKYSPEVLENEFVLNIPMVIMIGFYIFFIIKTAF